MYVFYVCADLGWNMCMQNAIDHQQVWLVQTSKIGQIFKLFFFLLSVGKQMPMYVYIAMPQFLLDQFPGLFNAVFSHILTP